jgi:hemolysin-activating ACP:hemolysin acyltransferase
MSIFVHAPGLGIHAVDDMAALGGAMWIGLHSPLVHELSLHQCHQLFLTPQMAKAYVLLGSAQSHGGWTPMLWLAFAALDAHHEAQYVRHPDRALDGGAWNSGDRLWLIHLITCAKLTPEMVDVLAQLFEGRTARSLSPSSHRLGQTIRVWRGRGVSSQEANSYWKRRPILA